MRHRNRNNHLGRTASHRAALLANMANSLFLHKRIVTTLVKARELRKYAEPLITKSKFDTTHSRRTVFSYLQNKFSVKALFTEIAPKIEDRPGGYTRILKLGPRNGDGAEMALIEIVDFNEYLEGESLGKKARKKNIRPKSEAPTAAKVNQESQIQDSPAAETTSETEEKSDDNSSTLS